MCVFLEKSITPDDKSRVSALSSAPLKTKRTVSCEYPSREIQVARHRMTDALCNSTVSVLFIDSSVMIEKQRQVFL